MIVDNQSPAESDVYTRLARELFATELLNELVDDVKVRFVYSTRLFSRMATTTLSVEERDEEGNTRLVDRHQHSIYLDMPGLWFLVRYATGVFYPQRNFSEYFEGVLTGTLYAIDELGTTRITTQTDYLNEKFGPLMKEIRTLPETLWDTSFEEPLQILRSHFFPSAPAGEPENIDRLIFNVIARFTLGHEAGHYIFDHVPKRRKWVLESARTALPDHAVAEDHELFGDIIGFEHCIQLELMARRDLRPALTVLMIILALMDVLGLAQKTKTARGVMSGHLRTQLLMGHLTASPSLDKGTKRELAFTIMDSFASAEELSLRTIGVIVPAFRILEAKTRERISGVGRQIAAIGRLPDSAG
jgi:hypothetical protein